MFCKMMRNLESYKKAKYIINEDYTERFIYGNF